MTELHITINDLNLGHIISEDIFANTNSPIIRKDTEVLTKHIEILHAFNIRKIKVKETQLVNANDEPSSSIEELDNPINFSAKQVEKFDIQERYKNGVQSYKKEFLGWNSGVRPDIAKVRSITMPLLEAFIEQKGMLTILSDFSDAKDYLYHHSIAVGILATAISRKMNLPIGDTLQLGLAGALADCGMAKIDRIITEKTAFLTKEEYNQVKKHTIYSYQMVQDTPLLRQEMKLAIFQHHERLDGTGYPRGDKLEQVSTYSQILAVADVFHAMTSERVYRSKESPFKVIEMIEQEEFGKFNLKVVHALHELVGNISIGTKVQLTNGEVGEVLFVHRDARLRPMIKKNADDTILDLAKNRHLAIDRII